MKGWTSCQTFCDDIKGIMQSLSKVTSSTWKQNSELRPQNKLDWVKCVPEDVPVSQWIKQLIKTSALIYDWNYSWNYFQHLLNDQN